jgi:hypothetical protein
MRPEFEVGQLVIADGRQGRVVKDCTSFVVVTVGDPERGHIAKCQVIAVPDYAVERVYG